MSTPDRANLGANQQQEDHRVRKVELIISAILRIGVLTSFVLVIAGTVVSFVRHPDYISSRTELQRLTYPGAAFPHSIDEVMAGLTQFRGQAIVVVGLIALIATPVTRVAVSIIAFVYQRDPPFVIITSVVLILLLLSFLLGSAGA